MNNQRRKEIAKLIERIETIVDDAKTKLEEVKDDIDNLRDEEECAFDSLPEGIQESERGDAMQEAIENLSNACDTVEELIDNIDTDDLTSYLNEAMA